MLTDRLTLYCYNTNSSVLPFHGQLNFTHGEVFQRNNLRYLKRDHEPDEDKKATPP